MVVRSFDGRTSTGRPRSSSRATSSFRSPYEGANSLSGKTQFANTVSATAFLGLRLWRGGALYFNPGDRPGLRPQPDVGIAAFPNGEAQKASYPVPRLDVDRLMVRQTFGLGGEQAVVEDGPNQLPETRDVSRITVTVGRFSVGDAFFLNTYATDPRTQFLNWNIYGCGSYDWTMDRPGFTWGALAELNQARWALRAGYFLETTVSNGDTFDMHIPTRGQYLVEPEVRYSLLSRPGMARLMVWVTPRQHGQLRRGRRDAHHDPGVPEHRADAHDPGHLRRARQRRAGAHPRSRRRSPGRAGPRASSRSWAGPTATRACRSARS